MNLPPTDAHADDRTQQGSSGRPATPDGVVFVDSTGRRALLLRRAGIVFSAGVLVYAAMIGVAFMGGPSLAPSQLTPFESAGTAQEPGGDEVRPAGSPSARHSAKPCGKHCGKWCRKHPGARKHAGKLCRGRPFGKPGKQDGPAPARSAPSSVEGR